MNEVPHEVVCSHLVPFMTGSDQQQYFSANSLLHAQRRAETLTRFRAIAKGMSENGESLSVDEMNSLVFFVFFREILASINSKVSREENILKSIEELRKLISTTLTPASREMVLRSLPSLSCKATLPDGVIDHLHECLRSRQR